MKQPVHSYMLATAVWLFLPINIGFFFFVGPVSGRWIIAGSAIFWIIFFSLAFIGRHSATSIGGRLSDVGCGIFGAAIVGLFCGVLYLMPAVFVRFYLDRYGLGRIGAIVLMNVIMVLPLVGAFFVGRFVGHRWGSGWATAAVIAVIVILAALFSESRHVLECFAVGEPYFGESCLY